MRLREVFVATLVAGCGSVADNSNNIDASIDGPDTTAPMILGSHPAKDETKVSVIAPISIMFDEALDPTTVSATTVKARYASNQSFYDMLGLLKLENAGPVPSGTVSYDETLHKITFKPLLPLPYNARIDITLDGIKDKQGNALAATHLKFTTLANFDRYWTGYNGNAITSYIDFGTMNGQQAQYTSAQVGPDLLWYTADDVRSGRFSNTYDSALPSRFVQSANYSPGADGLYFTSDDVAVNGYLVKYDANDNITSFTFGTPGTDAMVGTADDVTTSYYGVTYQGDNFIGYIVYNNPGLDGVWKTADDKTPSSFSKVQYDAMGKRTRIITYNPGADQLPGTAADSITFYDDLTTDAHGLVTQSVRRNGPGPDTAWFTADDLYGSYIKTVRDANGLATETQNFGAPGPDAVWLTADDPMNGRRVIHFNANGQSTEESQMGPGPDAILGNADDVPSSLQTETYDTNGARISLTSWSQGPDGLFKTADDAKQQVQLYDTLN